MANTPRQVDFDQYRAAAGHNDLDHAARALAGAADREVTESYVRSVNEQMGVQTSLTAGQIGEAAATAQETGNTEEVVPLPY